MNNLNKGLAIVAGILAALIIYFGLVNGVAFGVSLMLAVTYACWIGLIAIGITFVAGALRTTTPGAAITTAGDTYLRAFLIATFVSLIIFEVQLLLLVRKSNIQFIPKQMIWILFIASMATVIIAVIVAIMHWSSIAIARFRAVAATGNGWKMIAFGAFTLLVLGLLIYLTPTGTFSVGDPLFNPGSIAQTQPPAKPVAPADNGTADNGTPPQDGNGLPPTIGSDGTQTISVDGITATNGPNGQSITEEDSGQ